MSTPITTYGVDDVVEMLGGEISAGWVREQARKGRLPHLRVGYRAIRFTATHIDQILTQLEHTPEQKAAPLTGLTSRSRTRRMRRTA